MNVPTLILAPLLVVSLMVAGFFVARMVRGWGESTDMSHPLAESADRVALEGLRDRTLATLKDLEVEYALGKLSAEDYEDLRHFYEAEAVRILHQLEVE